MSIYEKLTALSTEVENWRQNGKKYPKQAYPDHLVSQAAELSSQLDVDKVFRSTGTCSIRIKKSLSSVI